MPLFLPALAKGNITSENATADTEALLHEVSGLHDAENLSINYAHTGIARTSDGPSYALNRPELHICVLAPSIWDSVVKFDFESFTDWQINGTQLGIFGTLVSFDEQYSLIRTTTHSTKTVVVREFNYIITYRIK